MRDYYDILDIKSNSSKESIKKAYKILALKWHPDRNIDNKEDVDETNIQTLIHIILTYGQRISLAMCPPQQPVLELLSIPVRQLPEQ